MNKDTVIIPKACPPKYLGMGVHLVTIKDVKNNVDDKGVPVTDKNGNPSMKFTMTDDNGLLFIDRIFYGNEKVQWVLDGLMKALGIDNTDREVTANEVVGKEVFVALEEVVYVDNKGDTIIKDGEPKVYINRYRYFRVIDKNNIPVLSVDSLRRVVRESGEKDEVLPIADWGEPEINKANSGSNEGLFSKEDLKPNTPVDDVDSLPF